MKRLASLVPVLLLVLSCSLPPYNEDLSLARMSAADMDLVTEVGPFKFWPGELRDKDVYFYPSKDALSQRTLDGVTPLRGFALMVGQYYGRLVSVEYDAINEEYYTTGDRGLDIGNSDPDRFTFTGQTVKDGAAGPPEHIGAAVFRPDGARWYVDFDQFFGESYSDLNAAGPAIGASFFPDVAAASDYFHLLVRDPGLGTYAEGTWTAGAGGLGGQTWFRGGMDLPGLPTEIDSAFYFHNPDPALLQRSYLSWYDPERREYRSFRWDDTLQLHVMTSLQKRIDLLLSTGWLFSRGENLGYLYDAEGRFLNQFALGGLNLAYEIYLGGTPHVVFTIEAWAPAGRREDPTLYFLVYTLPTSELADL